ncbi:unnamed protein product [Trichobilharzia szidati]|nr:unnamed protein product [Trichobilharzia szidati]
MQFYLFNSTYAQIKLRTTGNIFIVYFFPFSDQAFHSGCKVFGGSLAVIAEAVNIRVFSTVVFIACKPYIFINDKRRHV